MGSHDFDLGRFRLACSASALLLVGCSGGARRVPPSRGLQQEPVTATADQAVADARPVVPPPDAPAASPVAAFEAAEPPAPRGHEVALRDELALADDPTEAALALVARLREEERLDEALHVVEVAQGRHADPSLQVLRASLLRDVGRRHLAVAELRDLLRQTGPDQFAPALLLELAELEWLEGEREAATGTLHRLHATRGIADAETADVRTAAERLGAEISSSPRPRTMRARDLLGNLRGAPSSQERLAALERLAGPGRIPGTAGVALGQRAVAIASADPVPAVRARAVQLAQPPTADREDFCRAALEDESGLVRRCAVSRTVELLGRSAIPLLIERLQYETDEMTFPTIDAALCSLFPGSSPQPAAGLTAASRQAVATQWQQRAEGGR